MVDIPFMSPTEVKAKAKTLKKDESFTAQLDARKLSYDGLNRLMRELGGYQVTTISGCYSCPEHKDNPVHHQISVRNTAIRIGD